jgi:hypothetical protein
VRVEQLEVLRAGRLALAHRTDDVSRDRPEHRRRLR